MWSNLRRLTAKRQMHCRRLAADAKSPIDIPGPPPNKLFQAIRIVGATVGLYIAYYILKEIPKVKHRQNVAEIPSEESLNRLLKSIEQKNQK